MFSEKMLLQIKKNSMHKFNDSLEESMYLKVCPLQIAQNYEIKQLLYQDTITAIYIVNAIGKPNESYIAVRYKKPIVHLSKMGLEGLPPALFLEPLELITCFDELWGIFDYMPYPSLFELLESNFNLTPMHINWIANDLLLALNHLHNHNLIHGYLSLHNILITPTHIILVAIRVSCDDESPETLPMQYIDLIAPELFNNNHKSIGPWSDLYSVGKILRQMKYKLSDHDDTTSGYLSEQVLMRMTADSIDKRFQSVSDLNFTCFTSHIHLQANKMPSPRQIIRKLKHAHHDFRLRKQVLMVAVIILSFCGFCSGFKSHQAKIQIDDPQVPMGTFQELPPYVHCTFGEATTISLHKEPNIHQYLITIESLDQVGRKQHQVQLAIDIDKKAIQLLQ